MAKSNAPEQKAQKKTRLQCLYIVAAILLLAAWGTSIMVSSSMAKFAASNSVSDNARVAKFSVTPAVDSTQTTSALTLNSENKNAIYKFNVTSNSEVTTSYDVKLTLPADTELKGVAPTLKVGDSGTPVSAAHASGTNEYTFSGVNTVSAGVSQTDALTLTFELNDSATESADYSGIKLDVVATQID